VVSIVGDKLPVLESLVKHGRTLQSVWEDCERDPSDKAKQKVQAAEDKYLAAHAKLRAWSGQSMAGEESGRLYPSVDDASLAPGSDTKTSSSSATHDSAAASSISDDSSELSTSSDDSDTIFVGGR
jgi:hypothetical protein